MKFENGMEVTTSDGYTRILTRWTKNGKDRVYINGGSRMGDGFVDLITGEIHLYNTTNYAKEVADMVIEMFKTEDIDKKIETIAEQKRTYSELRQAYRECTGVLKEDVEDDLGKNKISERRVNEIVYDTFKRGTQKTLEKLENLNNGKLEAYKRVIKKYDIKINMSYEEFVGTVNR